MNSLDHYRKAARDLNVYGTSLEIEMLIRRIEQELDGEWFRAHEAEKEFRDRTGKIQFVFIRAHRDDRRGIAVELKATEYGLSLYRIVPEQGIISLAEFNAITVDFFLRFLDPAALDLGLPTEISSDELYAQEICRRSMPRRRVIAPD